jgi:hypothetical protein
MRYTMGYGNNKIYYIVFSDQKSSHQGIIQCIGGGTTPGNGSNLNP